MIDFAAIVDRYTNDEGVQFLVRKRIASYVVYRDGKYVDAVLSLMEARKVMGKPVIKHPIKLTKPKKDYKQYTGTSH